MKPHHITNAAVKGIAGNVALTMGRTESYIYSLGEDPEKDRYTRFVQFWLAVAGEDLSRAGMFVTDLASRFEALERRKAGRANGAADSHALSKLCSQLIDNIILEGRGRATDADVHSSARKLHAALGAFISAGFSGEGSRGGGGPQTRADTQEASSRATRPAAASGLEDDAEECEQVGEEAAALAGVCHPPVVGVNGHGRGAHERQ